MDNSAFTGGVEPGGLRTQGEIKLLLCYILKSADCDLSDGILMDVIQKNGLANFFEAKSALAELIEKGNILLVEEGDACCYRITDTGRMVAETLADTLPLSIRENAVNAALSVLHRGKIRQENRVVFHELEQGVEVECHITDREQDMMCIRLRLPDLLQANEVKRRFQQDPLAFYYVFTGMLVGEKEIINEALHRFDAAQKESAE